jgi:hypothetical protein
MHKEHRTRTCSRETPPAPTTRALPPRNQDQSSQAQLHSTAAASNAMHISASTTHMAVTFTCIITGLPVDLRKSAGRRGTIHAPADGVPFTRYSPSFAPEHGPEHEHTLRDFRVTGDLHPATLATWASREKGIKALPKLPSGRETFISVAIRRHWWSLQSDGDALCPPAPGFVRIRGRRPGPPTATVLTHVVFQRAP